MEKRTFILACGPICVALMWFVTSFLTKFSIFAPPSSDDIGSRFAFVIRWLLVPGSCLLIGIFAMVHQRSVSKDGVTGTRTPSCHYMEINIRFIQNTLEQLVLAAIAWLGLAIELDHANLGLIGCFALYFGVGRVLFVIGYLNQGHEELRAPGMTLTILPTIGSFIWLLYVNCARNLRL